MMLGRGPNALHGPVGSHHREQSGPAFAIRSWAAFAPGLESQERWQAWARLADLPAGEGQPEVVEMPAMARRRLGPLGRAAVQVAYWCQGSERKMPVVLASRYGDATRSLQLLADLARGEVASPTAFGLSVHNAVGAQYSIARGDNANFISLAGGAASAAAAVLEAVALLHDGHPEVLVVCYDAPLPGDYAWFADEPATTYAWAWRVALPEAGSPCFELSHASAAAEPGTSQAEPTLPFGLDVLRFTLSNDASLIRRADAHLWTWRRCNG